MSRSRSSQSISLSSVGLAIASLLVGGCTTMRVADSPPLCVELIQFSANTSVKKPIAKDRDQLFRVKYMSNDNDNTKPIESQEYLLMTGASKSGFVLGIEDKPFSHVEWTTGVETHPIPATPPSEAASSDGPTSDASSPSIEIPGGWGFVTIRWPMIWVQNIRAGSIATTALMRWDPVFPNTLHLYVIRNGVDEYFENMIDPTLVSDLNTMVQIQVDDASTGTMLVENIHFADDGDCHIIRRTFKRETPTAPLKLQMVSGNPLERRFAVKAASTGSGFKVTTCPGTPSTSQAERIWLQEILSQAHRNRLYALPASE